MSRRKSDEVDHFWVLPEGPLKQRDAAASDDLWRCLEFALHVGLTEQYKSKIDQWISKPFGLGTTKKNLTNLRRWHARIDREAMLLTKEMREFVQYKAEKAITGKWDGKLEDKADF